MRAKYTLLLLLAFVALVPLASFAHETRPAYLEMKETAPGQFSILWRTPVLAGLTFPELTYTFDYSTRPGCTTEDRAEVTGTISLLGPPERIADRLAELAEAGVTTVNVSPYARTVEDRVGSLRILASAVERAGLA